MVLQFNLAIPAKSSFMIKAEQLEHSVVHIENGHVTGRKLGDGPSRVVFDTLSKDPAKIKDRLSYLTKTDRRWSDFEIEHNVCQGGQW